MSSKRSNIAVALVAIVGFIGCISPFAFVALGIAHVREMLRLEKEGEPVNLGAGTQLEIWDFTKCYVNRVEDGGLVQEIAWELDSRYEFAPIEGADGYVYRGESNRPALSIEYGIVGAGSWVRTFASLDEANEELERRGFAIVKKRDLVRDYDIMRAGIFPPP